MKLEENQTIVDRLVEWVGLRLQVVSQSLWQIGYRLSVWSRRKSAWIGDNTTPQNENWASIQQHARRDDANPDGHDAYRPFPSNPDDPDSPVTSGPVAAYEAAMRKVEDRKAREEDGE